MHAVNHYYTLVNPSTRHPPRQAIAQVIPHHRKASLFLLSSLLLPASYPRCAPLASTALRPVSGGWCRAEHPVIRLMMRSLADAGSGCPSRTTRPRSRHRQQQQRATSVGSTTTTTTTTTLMLSSAAAALCIVRGASAISNTPSESWRTSSSGCRTKWTRFDERECCNKHKLSFAGLRRRLRVLHARLDRHRYRHVMQGASGAQLAAARQQ